MDENGAARVTRREFVEAAAGGLVGAGIVGGFPTIVPSSVLGRHAPGNRINVGAIGTGRISRAHDMPGVWKYETARIVAVCDVDARRAEDGVRLVNGYYSGTSGKPYAGVTAYADYRELLANKDVDAVLVSTPDHWHASIAIAAVRAGKDVYLQKPASLTIAEGRALADAVRRSGRIFQIGSQQRSSPQFRQAAELVRNGRIGRLQTVEDRPARRSVRRRRARDADPPNLDYDKWLGSTPAVYYTEKRVHPQSGYDRPGWLRCEQFGAGMITGWGAHHLDSAHWAMNTELTGPVEVWGTRRVPQERPVGRARAVQDRGALRRRRAHDRQRRLPQRDPVRGNRRLDLRVARGRTRDRERSAVGPEGSPRAGRQQPRHPVVGHRPEGVHLYRSTDHHGNWLECVRSRRQPIAPVEVAHRSCSACLLHHIAMKLKRRLRWDPKTERFIGDDEANAMLSRPQRAPYRLT